MKIIVERDAPEHWLAWFSDAPQQVAGGPWPSDAVARLILLFRPDGLELDEASPIDAATRDGHLEYMIPLKGVRRIPLPSVN